MRADLNLVRVVLDRRELLRIARDHRLPRGADDGYVLHAGLAQLFATSSEPAEVPLRPFAVDDTSPVAASRPDLLYLLGYADLDEGGLLSRMRPDVRVRLVRHCATRAVPVIEAGVRAIFHVRACPTVRTKHPGEHGPRLDARGRRKSREVDAWIASRLPSWTDEPPAVGRPFERSSAEWTDRERVYGLWLAKELGRGGAAELEDGVRLAAFAREAVYRRGESAVPRRRAMERPNAVLEGTLRVREPTAFRALLRRGVGRHRAFGFGMLLLRPA